jgi:branched-chain amino acid transport system ATP-binding protein
MSPTRGSIVLDGNDVTTAPSYKIARAGVGLVPEGRQIFPNLNVRENLVATAHNRQNLARPWTLDRIYALFPRLQERSGNLGSRLSGGEQQMLAIGRALMTNPRLLILDEATEGLAPLIRTEIWNCLARLKQTGLAIICIDKNLGSLLPLADQHYIVEKGRVVWSGTSEQLDAQRADLQAYMGV